MNRNLMLGVTVVLAGLAYVSMQQPVVKSKRDELVLAKLDPSGVVSISLRNAGETIQMQKQGANNWEVSSLAGFGAEADRVSELMLKLSTLKYGDKISSGNRHFAQFDLDDSKALKVELTHQNGSVEVLYLGKERMREGGMFGSVPDGQYMRTPHSEDVFLLKDGLDISVDPMNWILRKLPELKSSEIASMQINAAGTESVRLSKTGTDTPLSLADLQATEVLNASAADAWTKVLENLSFASLKPLTSAEVSEVLTSYTTLIAKTFAGLVMSLDISEAKNSGGNHLVRLGFSSESSDPIVMGKVESFVRRYANWVIELPAWSVSGLIKSRADLITHPEIGARHILLSLENRTKDEALSLGQSLIERLKAGESFAELAKEFSSDASNRDNAGDLGTFGKGRMVKPFEDAAYGLKVGEITSEPVETEFGYHIIERTQ